MNAISDITTVAFSRQRLRKAELIEELFKKFEQYLRSEGLGRLWKTKAIRGMMGKPRRAMLMRGRQLGFTDYEQTTAKKRTRREKFLAEMERWCPGRGWLS
jgi:hypothetical protein